jgi:hypothetical protein
MKKIILTLFLLLPLAVQAKDLKFDIFQANFRMFHAFYVHGPAWTQQEVDREAVKIWRGSGEDYIFASTQAVIGAIETNYDYRYKNPGYKGFHGMRNNTCLVELARLRGIKKWTPKQRRELLAFWKKNPWEADKLAASRFVWLTRHYDNEMGIAIFTYYKGPEWRKDTHKGRKTFGQCLEYLKGILKLRETNFGIPAEIPEGEKNGKP